MSTLEQTETTIMYPRGCKDASKGRVMVGQNEMIGSEVIQKENGDAEGGVRHIYVARQS